MCARRVRSPATGASHYPALKFHPGRERSLLRRHPWIFSGAVASVSGEPLSGDTVQVRSDDGSFLAWAAYSPRSQIRARVWSFEDADIPGPDLFRRRLEAALSLRRALPEAGSSDGLRLVHGESDRLPGLIVDRYADTLVVQILAAGCERWRAELMTLLRDITGCKRIYERSEADAREQEGLAKRSGPVFGGEPPDPVEIRQHELRFLVDLAGGQKTGFFLDQRDNRHRVRALCADRDVLDCFCYSGGFSLAALAGGARSVIGVDSSAEALVCARRNLAANGFTAAQVTWLEADVFRFLRDQYAAGRSYDAIVLDPPKFAPTQRHAQAAARAYKDINLSALRLLRPGGLLATFPAPEGSPLSCFKRLSPALPPTQAPPPV